MLKTQIWVTCPQCVNENGISMPSAKHNKTRDKRTIPPHLCWRQDKNTQNYNIILQRHTLVVRKWQTPLVSGLGGLEVACWPLVPKFAGFTPGRSRRIFRAKKKILSTPSFGRGVKPSVPCRRFAAFRSLNVTWKSTFRQNLPDISLPQFHLPWLTRVETPSGESWNF